MLKVFKQIHHAATSSTSPSRRSRYKVHRTGEGVVTDILTPIIAAIAGQKANFATLKFTITTARFCTGT